MIFARLFIFSIFLTGSIFAQRPLTVEDIMKFNHIKDVTISADGEWVGYATTKDRGDGKGVIRATKGAGHYRIPLGRRPVISNKGAWAAMEIVPSLAETEKAKKKKKKLKNAMVLINTLSGKSEQWERVKSFAFSDDELWFARLFHEEEKEEEDKDKKADKKKKKEKEELGTRLVLRRLQTGDEYQIDGVTRYAFDKQGKYLVYAVALPGGEGNGLFMRYLTGDPSSPATIEEKTKSSFANIAWAPDGSHLTWLQTVKAEESKKPAAYDLHLLQIDKLKRHQASDIPSGWHIPSQSKLQWTEDNQRLFFGLRPTPKDAEVEEEVKKEKEKEEMSEDDSEADMYDIESIRKKNELDVWHHKDKRIKTVVKTSWKETSKRTFAAVFHIKSKKTVQLADETIPSVNFTQNAQGVLAATNVPHARKLLWTGNMTDLYHIDLQNGKRTLIQEKFQQNGAWTLSPGGRYIAYMKDDKVFLLDVRRNRTRILNEGLDVSFFDEDHDRPSKARGYGFGGWVKDDAAVLAYDKYDIWVFPTREKETPYQLTGNVGRTKDLRFRVRDLREKGRTYFEPDERLLLESYNYEEKNYGYYAAELGKQNVHPRLEGPKRYRFKVKAERADKIVYSQESFEEFPDLWVSDSMLNGPRRLSTENPQISEFIWGKPELVSWTSMDGKPLKGVLIKPENYQEGKRYPVLVYYYRFFSQRMYEFNEMVVNHRPNFPFYTSNGYCVFLPDIHFTVGEPGMSAVRSLVPGVQKLIDMGVADPEAVGLHGHSWSGYQSAYVVTQTDMFACTIAGAPVGNMTSAYTGIRLGSGWGRLFQYERGQSRLGGSLWERRDLYIENSPVFFADRINTPTLIMFGDEDTAVPWQQGVELYLAMRRLGKDVIFLQYHGEPHHLKKYPNKVDYTLKMKEYLDHYLKGEPPAPWISEGVPYKGK